MIPTAKTKPLNNCDRLNPSMDYLPSLDPSWDSQTGFANTVFGSSHAGKGCADIPSDGYGAALKWQGSGHHSAPSAPRRPAERVKMVGPLSTDSVEKVS